MMYIILIYLQLCEASGIDFVSQLQAVQDINCGLVNMDSVSCDRKDTVKS